MIDIAKFCEMDHFITLVDDRETVFDELKLKFEDAGFPVNTEAGKGREAFKTVTVHIGRSYFELLRIIGGNAPDWDKEFNNWYNNGVRGVVVLFLRSKNLDKVYHDLQGNGVYAREPYRDYYQKGHEKKSFPWRFLDLPPIENLPLWIRFIQYDTMLWNILRSAPRPNSKDLNKVKEIQSLKISGPFTGEDFDFLQKVFPELKENNTGKVNLRKNSIIFEKSEKTAFLFEAPTQDEKWTGKSVNVYNFSLNTVSGGQDE